MGVVGCTPQTCSFTLALCAAMIRRPFLASVALANDVVMAAMSFGKRSDTSVMLKPQKDPLPQDSLLSFLIFKRYYYLVGFGPCFFVQKPRNPGQLEIVSLFKLSFENAII